MLSEKACVHGMLHAASMIKSRVLPVFSAGLQELNSSTVCGVLWEVNLGPMAALDRVWVGR